MCYTSTLECGVNFAVIQFNEGPCGLRIVLNDVGIEPGCIMTRSSSKTAIKRVRNIELQPCSTRKKRRKKLRSIKRVYRPRQGRRGRPVIYVWRSSCTIDASVDDVMISHNINNNDDDTDDEEPNAETRTECTSPTASATDINYTIRTDTEEDIICTRTARKSISLTSFQKSLLHELILRNL